MAMEKNISKQGTVTKVTMFWESFQEKGAIVGLTGRCTMASFIMVVVTVKDIGD
jgi:hypothetical protein